MDRRYAGIGRRIWVCRCDCGNECIARGDQLKRGQVVGCGCVVGESPLPKYRSRGTENLGKGLTIRLRLFNSAKRRAKEKGIPFDLGLDDITVPRYCPILGIEFVKNSHRGFSAHSISLDRIIPELGYVRGNVQVISGRANMIKRDATLDELIALGNFARSQRERLNQKTSLTRDDATVRSHGNMNHEVNHTDQFAPNAFDPGGEIGGAVSLNGGHTSVTRGVKFSLIDSKAAMANEAEPIRDRERLSERTPLDIWVMQQSVLAGIEPPELDGNDLA